MDLVLVHGSFHGAWCWERLIPALEAYGHRVIAVDLPISEPPGGHSPFLTRPEESAGIIVSILDDHVVEGQQRPT